MVSLYRDPHGEKIFTDQRNATVIMDVAAPYGRTDGLGLKDDKSSGLIIKIIQSNGSVTNSNQSEKSSNVSQSEAEVEELEEETKEVSLAHTIL